jgi:hypothetical protein
MMPFHFPYLGSIKMVTVPAKAPLRQPHFRTARSCWNSSCKHADTTARRAKSCLKQCIRGNDQEEKKVVLKSGYRWSLFKCSVHILPICATIIVAYFNLAGYFIGSSLQGLTGDTYQAIDRLCLQVTAKLLVSLCLVYPSAHAWLTRS